MNPFRLSSRLQPGGRESAPRAREPQPRGREPARGAVPDREPGRWRPPASGRDPVPVAVPWRVAQRSASGVIEVEQCGDTPLHSVRFALAGKGMLGLSLPRTVFPGERVRVAVRGVTAEGVASARDSMLVMRWFEPDGTELLWPIAL